jgi:hypothetical protein
MEVGRFVWTRMVHGMGSFDHGNKVIGSSTVFEFLTNWEIIITQWELSEHSTSREQHLHR